MRSRSRRGLAILSLMGCLTVFGISAADASTYYVPDDFVSIQGAINAAVNGDVILVKPGIYQENLSIPSKTFVLKSTDGPESTIIDGRNSGSTISFWGNYNRPELEGFTITNGSNSGIFIYRTAPIIRNSRIVGNSGYNGGGIYAISGACGVEIRDSVISENNAMYVGGGIYSNIACVSVTNSRIVGNKAGMYGGGAVGYGYCGGVGIYESLIAENSAGYGGGGLYSAGTRACNPGVWSQNSVIARNTSESGGGVYVGTNGRGNLLFSTVTENSATQGGGFFSETNTYFRIINSIIYGNTSLPVLPTSGIFGTNILAGSDIEGGIGQGYIGDGTNISADPLFADPANSNYSLLPGSPAIDTAVTKIVYPDGRVENLANVAQDMKGIPRPQGDGYDMGALESYLPLIDAGIELAPKTLNLGSEGNWITAYISLPQEYDPSAVIIESVELNGGIPAVKGEVQDGKLMVKFDRESIADYLALLEGEPEMLVTGKIGGVALFKGTSRIRIIAGNK